MLGGSVGTSLLNTIFAAAVTSYLTAHLAGAAHSYPRGSGFESLAAHPF
jgi:hypothetical protein